MRMNFDRNLTEFWRFKDSNDSVGRPSNLSSLARTCSLPMPSVHSCVTLGARFDRILFRFFKANFADFRQLVRARSRLYQRRFLQPNTHFEVFFKIYKICNPLHRSDLKISTKLRQTSSYFAQFSNKNRYFSTLFINFCSDFDEIFSEFRRIFQKMMKD